MHRRIADPTSTDIPKEEDTAPGELVAVVDDLIDQIGTRFSNLSTELIAKSEPSLLIHVTYELTHHSGRNVKAAGQSRSCYTGGKFVERC